jgi:hypothetical protein
MGGTCSAYGGEERRIHILVGKPKRRRPLGDQGVDRRIILRWIFGMWDLVIWTGLN